MIRINGRKWNIKKNSGKFRKRGKRDPFMRYAHGGVKYDKKRTRFYFKR
jgi:hypothetical protein